MSSILLTFRLEYAVHYALRNTYVDARIGDVPASVDAAANPIVGSSGNNVGDAFDYTVGYF